MSSGHDNACVQLWYLPFVAEDVAQWPAPNSIHGHAVHFVPHLLDQWGAAMTVCVE